MDSATERSLAKQSVRSLSKPPLKTNTRAHLFHESSRPGATSGDVFVSAARCRIESTETPVCLPPETSPGVRGFAGRGSSFPLLERLHPNHACCCERAGDRVQYREPSRRSGEGGRAGDPIPPECNPLKFRPSLSGRFPIQFPSLGVYVP